VVELPSISTGTGTALVAGAGNSILLSTSSRRWKTDIETLLPAAAREILRKLRPVLYKSLCAGDDPKASHIGLIAEEVAEVCPELVNFRDGVPMSVRYDKLPVLQLAAQGA
jgi:hypothetical protein